MNIIGIIERISNMDSKVYRVIDVQADKDVGECYLYCRDRDRRRCKLILQCVFSIVVGSSSKLEYLQDLINKVSDKYKDVIVGTVKQVDTCYRGRKTIVELLCPSNVIYNRILNDIKYNSYSTLFICNGYSTVEDNTLFACSLYGKSYVKISNGTVVAAEPHEYFDYQPIIASFDLEMYTLYVSKPKSDPYMASYIIEGIKYMIYSSEYCSYVRPSTEDIKYIVVPSNYEVAVTLIDLIRATDPDVVLGYNIYNADIKTLYYAMGSKGYQIQRAPRDPRPYYYQTRKIEKGYIESDYGLSLKLPGIDFVDVYMFLLGLLPTDEKDAMKLGDVGVRYVNMPKDDMTFGELTRIHDYGTIEDKMRVMDYALKDSMIPILLYKHFNGWNFHAGITNISGIRTQRIMGKGKIDITYGMSRLRAAELDVYVDSSNIRPFRPKGGLVLDVAPGLYDDITCLDVNSLYPSVVIAHNIDDMTIETCGILENAPNYKDLEDRHYYYHDSIDNKDYLEDSRGVWYSLDKNKASILPHCLSKLLQSRATLRAEAAKAKEQGDHVKASILDGQQLAAKDTANSACGAKGEQTPGNPVSNCVINDIITKTGQKILQLSEQTVKAQHGIIVGGDTDSIFIEYKGDMEKLLQDIHAKLPSNVRFKVEYKARKFYMHKKKNYVAHIPEGKDGSYKLKIAGFKAAKHSSCKAVQSVFRRVVLCLFTDGLKAAESTYTRDVGDYLRKVESRTTAMFSYRWSYGGKQYKDNTYRANIVEAMKSRGVELIAGNHLEVVLVLTFDAYTAMYKRNSPIKLPGARSSRAARIYTVEEVGDNVDVIDVNATFELQCFKYLNKMFAACSINVYNASKQ